MVFKMEGEKGQYTQSLTAKYVVKTLQDSNFKVFCYYSVQLDELIVLLKASVIFFFTIYRQYIRKYQLSRTRN
jgi:hypothetical protein